MKPEYRFNGTYIKLVFLTSLVLFLMTLVTSQPAFAESAKVSQVKVLTQGKYITVSAQLKEGFNDQILEAIQNGMPITFNFEIELIRDDLVKDNLIRASTVSHTVQYDSLKKVYRFTQTGKNANRKIITRKKSQYQDLMSTLKDIPVAPVYRLNPEEKYYIRVKANLDSDQSPTSFKSLFFFVPFNDFQTAWAQTSPISMDPDMEKPQEVKHSGDSENEEDLNDVIRSFNK